MLLKEVMQFLLPKKGDKLLDLTAGYGGHDLEILTKTENAKQSVLVDRDQEATKELKRLFGDIGPKIINQDFFHASEELISSKAQFDLILADLGVSSPHLNEGKRGFSFQQDGPLDMRMDQRQELTAEMIVNTFSKEEIGHILKTYGEEPKAIKIAEAIVYNRPIKSTGELAGLVLAVYGGHGRHHPATKTFQALRIAVNDELKLLTNSLPLWLQLLAPGGRMAVISFHSLEDRIVKQFFAEHGGSKRYDSLLKLLTKHPVRANPDEIAHNPRARSAKLRAVVKIKRKGVA